MTFVPVTIAVLRGLPLRIVQRPLQRLHESLARQCGAGDNIHFGALRLNGFRLQLGHRIGIDAGRRPAVLWIVQKRYGRDLAVGDSHPHLHLAVKSIGREAGIRPVLVLAAACRPWRRAGPCRGLGGGRCRSPILRLGLCDLA